VSIHSKPQATFPVPVTSVCKVESNVYSAEARDQKQVSVLGEGH